MRFAVAVLLAASALTARGGDIPERFVGMWAEKVVTKDGFPESYVCIEKDGTGTLRSSSTSVQEKLELAVVKNQTQLTAKAEKGRAFGIIVREDGTLVMRQYGLVVPAGFAGRDLLRNRAGTPIENRVFDRVPSEEE